ncbi:MAG TPA: hypothetical protein VNP37_00190, partial [Actinomycetospora sp.]|nr:hypothetical protein [Actinomycetospora sp.]
PGRDHLTRSEQMTAAVAEDPAAPPLAEAAPDPAPTPPPSASDRLRALGVSMIDRLAAAATVKVEEVADRLGDMAADAAKDALGGAGAGAGGGGVFANAVLQGGLAKLQGRNPVWAAIKGGVSAMSPTTKVLVGLLLILLAVLSPVLLIVLALVLLVAAIVGAVRS